MDLAVAEWKLKKAKKRDKYLDFARFSRKLWIMGVTVIPVDVGTLGTVIKGLKRRRDAFEIWVRIETIQYTASSNWSEYLEES